jgi:tetratricopeptide (TPR) repeat protein
LKRAVDLRPDFIPARIALAQACFKRGESDQGIDHLRQCGRDFPGNLSVRRALAEALYETKHYDEAIALFEKFAASSPTDEGIFNRLLEMYVATGAVEKASAGFQRLLEKGEIGKVDYLLRMADLQLEARNLREAGRLLYDARREDAGNPALAERFSRYYEAFAIKASADGERSRAIIYWGRALEFAPDDPTVLYSLARAYAQNGEHATALGYYRAVLKSSPTFPDFFVDFAETLMALRRLDIATGMFEPAIEAARKRGDTDAIRALEREQAEILRKVEKMLHEDDRASENK